VHFFLFFFFFYVYTYNAVFLKKRIHAVYVFTHLFICTGVVLYTLGSDDHLKRARFDAAASNCVPWPHTDGFAYTMCVPLRHERARPPKGRRDARGVRIHYNRYVLHAPVRALLCARFYDVFAPVKDHQLCGETTVVRRNIVVRRARSPLDDPVGDPLNRLACANPNNRDQRLRYLRGLYPTRTRRILLCATTVLSIFIYFFLIFFPVRRRKNKFVFITRARRDRTRVFIPRVLLCSTILNGDEPRQFRVQRPCGARGDETKTK
jgi:hypothetical protein